MNVLAKDMKEILSFKSKLMNERLFINVIGYAQVEGFTCFSSLYTYFNYDVAKANADEFRLLKQSFHQAYFPCINIETSDMFVCVCDMFWCGVEVKKHVYESELKWHKQFHKHVQKSRRNSFCWCNIMGNEIFIKFF